MMLCALSIVNNTFTNFFIVSMLIYILFGFEMCAYCILLLDYHLCFNGSPSYTINYYNNNSI